MHYELLKKASEWNKKAIKDVSAVYEWFMKRKAQEEKNRSKFTQTRAATQKEYEWLDLPWKVALLKDWNKWVPWFNIIADRLPSLVNKYPNLSVAEMGLKIRKIAELALTAKSKLDIILSKKEEDRTQEEKDLVRQYLSRWVEERDRSDRITEDTIALNKNNPVRNTNYWNISNRNTPTPAPTPSRNTVRSTPSRNTPSRNTVRSTPSRNTVRSTPSRNTVRSTPSRSTSSRSTSSKPKVTYITRSQALSVRNKLSRLKKSNPSITESG